jgi:hypothetical protein
MTAQIAVLLPMPSARVRAATAVNAEFLASSLGRRGKREWPTCYGQKEGNHSPFPNLHPGAHATLLPPAGWHLTPLRSALSRGRGEFPAASGARRSFLR